MEANLEHKPEIEKVLQNEWGDTLIISRGQKFQADQLPALVAIKNSKIVGLLTYHISASECEIISLNSLNANYGIGTALINEVKKVAKYKIVLDWLY